MQTRRKFLVQAATVGLGTFVPWSLRASPKTATVRLAKFTDPLLRTIPTLTPGSNPAFPGADYYEVYMAGGRWSFSSQLPVTAAGSAPTTWGYGSGSAFLGYLGPTIEARRGRPVVVNYLNLLDPAVPHPLEWAIDPTVPDPAHEGVLPPGRATPHLHGGFTAPGSDGHPHSWWTKNGLQGSHYATLPGSLPGEAVFQYTNDQPAAMLWYHDHAMGITRLNVYAGLAGLYFIRDALDTGSVNNPLRLPAGAYEIPLVIQDKQFNADGSLHYPTEGVTPVHPVWVPEFFGDTAVVNGRASPYLDVEPRRYRFRMLNASQARFYHLVIETAGGRHLPLWVIGMEQSLLSTHAVPLSALTLAPGERADVIVDFTGLRPGSRFVLNNTASAPFPGRGKPMAPRIPEIMEFRVGPRAAGAPIDTSLPPDELVLPGIAALSTTLPPREIVLKETMDPIVNAPTAVLLNERWFNEPIEETPVVGTTEIWEWINITGDAHPMHMHLVQFQVVNRQRLNAVAYDAAYSAWVLSGRLPATRPQLSDYLIGDPRSPAPEEAGWKDTVKALPDEVTRVIATFHLPAGASPGSEYVYHCHILEHEENEMMRPFKVIA